MMKFLIPVLALGACALPVTPSPAPDTPLAWLSGCWQTEDATTRETWSLAEGGHLFGYGLTFADGEPVFFEQMRIDLETPRRFSAYPAGHGPVAFTAISETQNAIVFANRDHDYPQKIAYLRSSDRLRATISKIDDSAAKTFAYRRCPMP